MFLKSTYRIPIDVMKLTDINVKNARPRDKPQKMSDGDGLFLFISPAGGKLWRLAYRFNGKQKNLSFGAYPAVSLKGARRRKDEAKELLAMGIDPGEHKKEQKIAAAQAEQKRGTLLSGSHGTGTPHTLRHLPISTR